MFKGLEELHKTRGELNTTWQSGEREMFLTINWSKSLHEKAGASQDSFGFSSMEQELGLELAQSVLWCDRGTAQSKTTYNRFSYTLRATGH